MKHFKKEKIAMLIIDEISALKPEFLAIIDQRLRTLTGKYDEEFGGLAVILMGDFFNYHLLSQKKLFTLLCSSFLN